jgi:hypothetical protein
MRFGTGNITPLGQISWKDCLAFRPKTNEMNLLEIGKSLTPHCITRADGWKKSMLL